MEEGTGYKLVMGIIMILVCVLLFIPLNEQTQQITGIFNAMNVSTETQERNNIAAAIFGSTLLFLFLAYGIWVLKSTKEGQ